jgi:uncharacterized protein (TIGR00255 family)
MIHSMTAFGRSQAEAEGFSLMVEIRTLNSRNLDIFIRFPRNCLELEDHCRKIIARSLRRGRIEVNAQLELKGAGDRAPTLNMALARQYWEQLQELHRRLPRTESPTLELLLRIPHLFENSDAVFDRDLMSANLTGAVQEALDQVHRMRAQEGEALLQDCLQRLSNVKRELSLIENQQENVLREYELRIRERVQQLLAEVPVDENRLLQEVAYFAERSDINEEVVRLRSHLDQMLNLLTATTPADGRKLDFLLQEMHREANTIGAKTGDLDSIRSVIEVKAEIGKLKEQIQNVE